MRSSPPPGERADTMDAAKPRMVGINHVAIEVGDIDAALAFYGEIFRFTLRGRGERNAFIGLGDQFIAPMQGSGAGKLEQQHFAARAGGEGHGGLTPAPAVLHPCRAQSADLRGGYAVPRLRRFPSYAGFSGGSSSAGSRPNS
jgi:catechol 2,3-dioxygenase-like lactoylglutathione lyase family enzyme